MVNFDKETKDYKQKLHEFVQEIKPSLELIEKIQLQYLEARKG